MSAKAFSANMSQASLSECAKRNDFIRSATEHEVYEVYRGCGNDSHERNNRKLFPVAIRLEVTPVLIPNTMVKI